VSGGQQQGEARCGAAHQHAIAGRRSAPWAAPAALLAQATVTCSSKPGERQSCPADTLRGCRHPALDGRSGLPARERPGGYDDAGVWVKTGCAGRVRARADRLRERSGAGSARARSREGALGAAAEERRRTPASRAGGTSSRAKGSSSAGAAPASCRSAPISWCAGSDQTPPGQTFTAPPSATRTRSTPGTTSSLHRAMGLSQGWIGTDRS